MRTGFRAIPAAILSLCLVACSTSDVDVSEGGPYPPGIDPKGEAVNGVEVGHRLIAAGEYELAIKAFNRSALDQGMSAEVLSGLGTANLGLGRLNQAERLLRRATTEYMPPYPEDLNNLGVVLMEKGETAEAIAIFRRAFALDDGESTLIRDNLRLALAKSDNSVSLSENDNEYKLVRRSSSDYVIRSDL